MNDRNSHDYVNGHNNNAPPSPSFMEIAGKILKPLASLQLTVVLFALSIVLVFFGTLAQMNEGIWTVVDKYFRSGIVWIPLQLLAKFFSIFFNTNPNTHWHTTFPFPGGWAIGTVMLVNLVAAHLVRFRMTWKRSGIFVIHAGVIMLMLGELVTGMYAVESTMTLALGETCNFVDETLTVELALSRPLDGNNNEVIKVPASRLKHKGFIRSDDLPVDIEVVEYWRNSKLDKFQQGPAPDTTWANLSDGTCCQVSERPEEAGVESEQRGDATSVRIKLHKKGGGEIGEFLLSLWYYPNSTMNSRILDVRPFQFDADGKVYTIELRNRRIYKPYSIRLLKFEHAKYEGTEMAKDFASTVEVIDPEYGNSETRIWMNNPLRYRESSFYQLSVLRQDSGTVLQAVNNPGRIMPYISCSMIAGGLLLHFGMLLVRFLNRRTTASAANDSAYEEGVRDQGLVRYLPIAVVALAAAWIVSAAMPPQAKTDAPDYYGAGKIPVIHNGRVKPLDTVARTALQAISGQSEVQDLDAKNKKQFAASAVQWYFDSLNAKDVFSGKAAKYKVFRIDNDQLLSLFELKPRPEFFRYSLEELEPRMTEFQAEVRRVQEKNDKKLNLRDTKILDLAKKLNLYVHMVRGELEQRDDKKGDTPGLIPPEAPGGGWRKLKEIDQQVEFSPQEERQAYERARKEMTRRAIKVGVDLDDLDPARVERMVGALQQHYLADLVPARRGEISAAAAALTQMAQSSEEGNAAEFNKALELYRAEQLKDVPTGLVADAQYETFFNHLGPFFMCSNLYVMVIILAVLSWMVWHEPLRRSAFWLAVLTFALHTYALGSRMYLQGRPPVTNLYSSAVFIGWGSVLLCLVLECFFRKGIALLVGGALGALTMMVAHFLSEGGDTMEMLQAVLDTNFWLATHVTMVTMGYVATLVAGAISIKYVVLGVLTKRVDQETNKVFGQMIYGVICFATFLSFTGTILGGIWADYSWGRFWGWDAKENGAVMVVVWNTLILHARWAGLVKLRGMAALAIVGNMITVWSWFGTNQLGAGLHSYGFSTELAERCMYTWLLMLLPIGMAMLPQRYWRSFAEDTLRERAALAKDGELSRRERERREVSRRPVGNVKS
jgi:ABC-type transport system involved in cytochrome c biogenesis permease subunit